MDSVNLIQIWKSGQGKEPDSPRYSMDQILAYRKGRSRQSRRSGKLSILFDIGYKVIIGLGLLYLLILPVPSIIRLVAGSLLLLNLALIGLELTFLRKLGSMSETETVVDNLKKQLHFLKQTYRRFVFSGAFSNPLFVMTGFLFYQYYTHGSESMVDMLSAPISYVFVLAALGISLGVQWPYYRQHVKEVLELLESVDNDSLSSMKIREQKKKRTKRIIMYAILFLLGILVFLLLLI